MRQCQRGSRIDSQVESQKPVIIIIISTHVAAIPNLNVHTNKAQDIQMCMPNQSCLSVAIL